MSTLNNIVNLSNVSSSFNASGERDDQIRDLDGNPFVMPDLDGVFAGDVDFCIEQKKNAPVSKELEQLQRENAELREQLQKVKLALSELAAGADVAEQATRIAQLLQNKNNAIQMLQKQVMNAEAERLAMQQELDLLQMQLQHQHNGHRFAADSESGLKTLQNIFRTARKSRELFDRYFREDAAAAAEIQQFASCNPQAFVSELRHLIDSCAGRSPAEELAAQILSDREVIGQMAKRLTNLESSQELILLQLKSQLNFIWARK